MFMQEDYFLEKDIPSLEFTEQIVGAFRFSVVGSLL